MAEQYSHSFVYFNGQLIGESGIVDLDYGPLEPTATPRPDATHKFTCRMSWSLPRFVTLDKPVSGVRRVEFLDVHRMWKAMSKATRKRINEQVRT